jgi:hypothetical protein
MAKPRTGSLVCMADVETEAGLRQRLEPGLQFFDRPARGLPLVHVLETEPLTEGRPQIHIPDAVGMYHDGPMELAG